MTINLEIPTPIVQALRLPPADQEQQLRLELAVALYAREILSFGKARELAQMGKYEFGVLLGNREIPRHYAPDDLEDDLSYAHC